MDFNSDRVRNCLKENATLEKEIKDVKQNAADLKTKLNERQEENVVLKGKLVKSEEEKNELLKEVQSFQSKMQKEVAKM